MKGEKLTVYFPTQLLSSPANTAIVSNETMTSDYILVLKIKSLPLIRIHKHFSLKLQ